MRKTAILAFVAALLVSVPVYANSIVQIGDLMQVSNDPNATATGGVFIFNDLTQGFSFGTFCIERDEPMNIGSIYYVSGISTQAVEGGIAGGSPDPLSSESAYLFDQWWNGTLSGYTGSGYGDATSQAGLQGALWILENEGLPTYISSNATYLAAALGFRDLANSQADGSLYGVVVLNLLNTTLVDGVYIPTTYAQDVLFTPEPATILLLGLGLTAVGLVARKRIRK